MKQEKGTNEEDKRRSSKRIKNQIPVKGRTERNLKHLISEGNHGKCNNCMKFINDVQNFIEKYGIPLEKKTPENKVSAGK